MVETYHRNIPILIFWTGQISNEIEHSICLMEGSVSRQGMVLDSVFLAKVLDSVQDDVVQVTRAVKEVSLESKC